MNLSRSSGVLLHITSLPGKYGCGTLGQEARNFADDLEKGGFTYWQILPTGPVSPGLAYSPYSSTSTFAGNYLMISPELLCKESWFKGIKPEVTEEQDFIDFDKVKKHRDHFFKDCFRFFKDNALVGEVEKFRTFSHEEKSWLDDFALFTALADHFKSNDWLSWDKDIALRKEDAILKWSSSLKDEIEYQKFLQFLFFSQWHDLKDYCNEKGIHLIGDIPIYITLDGADAWDKPEIFDLDEKTGKPLDISGVPPDYFSETGQRWGNPLYKWFNENEDGLNEETTRWWIKRIKHLTTLVDLLRIDHFRGFESFWSIPSTEETAINGQWEKGPGMELFNRINEALGDLPLIAEDLGIITPEVEELRDDLNLPGMKILQFAFDFNNKNYYLPHSINNDNYLLYTGTHDNNTTNGWFYGDEVDKNTRSYIMDYLGINDSNEFHWHLIKAAYRTVASVVIIPAQDILGFGSEYRMNTPGTIEGNWIWKLRDGAIEDHIWEKLRHFSELYNRLPETLT